MLNKTIFSILISKRPISFTHITKAQQFDKRLWNTAVCSNGTIVFWHPEKQFPVEHTLPINLEEVNKERQEFFELSQTKDLRHSNVPPYGRKGPQNINLCEIFYTDKQEWRSRYREKRLYKTIAPTSKRE